MSKWNCIIVDDQLVDRLMVVSFAKRFPKLNIIGAYATAKEAIDLYKSRDASEKLFRGDKSYLGNRSLRVYSDESASAKIFIEFIALIIRSKIFTNLKEEMKSLDKRPNFMTVPAAIKELEKIEMVRQLDNVYRLDHAVTAAQKIILKAFGIDVSHVKYKANEISDTLKK